MNCHDVAKSQFCVHGAVYNLETTSVKTNKKKIFYDRVALFYSAYFVLAEKKIKVVILTAKTEEHIKS